MTTGDSSEDRYTQALTRFAGAGDLRMARSVWDSMQQRGVEPTAEHLQLMVKAHLERRDLAGAEEFLSVLRARGVEPDLETRWDIAVATGRSGKTGAALGLLDQLHEQGEEPGPRHAAGVLAVYLNADRYPAARAILRRMAALGLKAPAGDYQRLLDDCLERRAIKDARTVIDLMIESGAPPSPAQVASVAGMMARAGHPDRAKALLALAAEAGVDTDPSVRTELLLAYAKAGDPAAARTTLEEMRGAGIEPNSFHHNAVLQAQVAVGDADAAWDIALELADRGRIPSGGQPRGALRRRAGEGPHRTCLRCHRLDAHAGGARSTGEGRRDHRAPPQGR